jgi:hypothetical protein
VIPEETCLTKVDTRRNELYAPAFERAYEQHGGEAQLGCATNPVTQLQDGYHQNLQGPHGRGGGVIMATQPNHAFVLAGAVHAAYVKIGGPDAGTGSVRIAGYPSSEQLRLSHGWKVELGAGGHWAPSALISKDHGGWYWVQSDLWARYNGDLGGPDGRIGYPVADAVGWNGGVRQQFEHDWLYFKASVGVLTAEEYASGRPPPATAPTASNPSQPSLAYKVDSDKGVAHQITPRGYVEQRFRPQLAAIDKLSAIVGLNTADSPTTPHLLRLELRDQAGVLLFSETLPVQNNVDTVATFTPLRVQPGALYTLRVVNASRDVVGIYLNMPVGSGRVAEASARAYVVGELGKQAGHLDEHGALCGFVETLAP